MNPQTCLHQNSYFINEYSKPKGNDSSANVKTKLFKKPINNAIIAVFDKLFHGILPFKIA